MAFSYTPQQQSVIDIRNRNVLVSAAAGSGKTAVLVERVIQMLLRGEIHMDELLVVTFTRAAATEMRERIGTALYREIAEADNPELKAELAMLPVADITTIHSFCLKLIRENYSQLSLEPDFAIGEEAVIAMLSQEALQEVMEEEFQKSDPEFLHFAKSFAAGIGDRILENLILDGYREAKGIIQPDKWMDLMAEGLCRKDNVSEEALWRLIDLTVSSARTVIVLLMEQTEDSEWKAFREQSCYFSDFFRTIQQAEEDRDYSKIYLFFQDYKAPRMPSAKKTMDPFVLEQLKQWIQELRAKAEFISSFVRLSEEENDAVRQRGYRLVKEWKRLIFAYGERFARKKAERNCIDFDDLEQYALRLLMNDDGERTEIAKQYQKKYREIIIDEYQDTNELQNRILELVSGAPDHPNAFMVGDIKQSIYQFRKAKPDIFLKKYAEYGDLDSPYAKIDMQQNFRSRPEILRTVNYLFTSIMTAEMSGMDYDHKAGFLIADDREEAEYYPKMILLERGAISDRKDRDAGEAEAIAQTIVELLESGAQVFDKAKGKMRMAGLEDMVILMRSPANALMTYRDIFLEHGIPLLAEEGKAYFMTPEVRGITDFLRTIDNPRMDVALLGTLSSVVYQFQPEDFAKIRIACPAEFFFDSMVQYVDKETTQEQAQTLEKVRRFLGEWHELKEKSYLLGLMELTEYLLQKTDYRMRVSLMENGAQRNLNVEAFLEKMAAFEDSEGADLFHFLQQMEKIYSLNLSFGDSMSEGNQAVRMMSIHKSKGLEFPVVFLSQLGKQFNVRDTFAPILMKEDLGIFPIDTDYQNRIQRESWNRLLLKYRMRMEILREEQRLLYVAMTRPREYMYLIGTVPNLEKAMDKWSQTGIRENHYRVDGFEGYRLREDYLQSAKNYLDWIMPSMLLWKELGRLEIEEILSGEIKIETEIRWDDLIVTENPISEETEPESWEELQFYPAYPYPEFLEQKISTSVSEQKQVLQPEGDFSPKRPQGAMRGTVYHKILAILPMEIQPDEMAIFLNSLVTDRILSEEEFALIEAEDFIRFTASELWKRMQRAAKKGILKREQPFILAIPLHSGEAVEYRMLQGIIDVFFEEKGQLILVDYKTDRISNGHKEELRERYREQMEMYRNALENILHKKVRAGYLYSLSLHQEIKVFGEEENGE